MKHILTSDQFSREELLEIFEEARKLQEAAELPQIMKGKILATVFLEPSTRTRLSFETAMLRLGGQVISIPNAENSSLNKGETVEDTGRMIDIFADIIAIRVPKRGQVEEFSRQVTKPVVNAGDGTGDHPTQILLDLYTIWKNRGTLDGLTMGLMGDCAHSRVLRGMARMSSVFEMNYVFISPVELRMEEDVKRLLAERGRGVRETISLAEVIGELDVLDVNRIRHEYFEDQERAQEIGKQFILTKEMVLKGRQQLIVLDPLPRINTVLPEIDELPQAKYFEAVENGVFVRMALMKRMLD